MISGVHCTIGVWRLFSIGQYATKILVITDSYLIEDWFISLGSCEFRCLLWFTGFSE